jgi:hypothetical protein
VRAETKFATNSYISSKHERPRGKIGVTGAWLLTFGCCIPFSLDLAMPKLDAKIDSSHYHSLAASREAGSIRSCGRIRGQHSLISAYSINSCLVVEIINFQ